MCRSIKNLRVGAVPASDSEVGAATLQFVRKITGFNKPSRANEEAWHRALDEISMSAAKLLAHISDNGSARTRNFRPSDTVAASSE